MVKEANKRYENTGIRMYQPGEGVAAEIGFMKETFDGYITVDSKVPRSHHPDLIFSMVISKEKHKGNFKKCVEAALEKGYKVVIPTPLGAMEVLVRLWKFKKRLVREPEMGVVEIWERNEKLEANK